MKKKPSLVSQYLLGAVLEQIVYWLLQMRDPDPWGALYMTLGMLVPLILFKPWVSKNSREIQGITSSLRPGTPIDYASQVQTIKELGGDGHKRKLKTFIALQRLWALVSGYLLMWIVSPIIIFIAFKG